MTHLVGTDSAAIYAEGGPHGRELLWHVVFSTLYHYEDRTRMYLLLKTGMRACKLSYIQQSFIDSELSPASVQET